MSHASQVVANSIISTSQNFSYFVSGFEIMDIECSAETCLKCLEDYEGDPLRAQLCAAYCTNCEAVDIDMKQTISCDFTLVASLTKDNFMDHLQDNLSTYAAENGLPLKTDLGDIIDSIPGDLLVEAIKKKEEALVGLSALQKLKIVGSDGTTVTRISMESFQNSVITVILQNTEMSKAIQDLDEKIQSVIQQNTQSVVLSDYIAHIIVGAIMVVLTYFCVKFSLKLIAV
jgi:hypothetical protein